MKKTFLLWLFVSFFCLSAMAEGLIDDYVDIAGELAREGKYPQALNYINKSLMIEPNNQNLLEMKSDLLKISGAKNQIEIPTYQNIGNEDFQQAEKARFNNEFAKSVALYKNSLSKNPDFPIAYLGLAISQYELKNFQECKNNLNSYLNLMPKSDFAYMLRAKANMNIGETQSALRDIKSAQVISNNLEYKLVEAIILCEHGKYQQSRNILNKISNEIQSFQVYKYLGICDLKLMDYKSAVMNFERAILLFDDDKTITPLYNEAKRMSNNG